MLPIILAVFLTQVPANTKVYDASLLRCYDGDTCDFDFHLKTIATLGFNIRLDVVNTLKNQSVRLCDINAPEIRALDTKVAGIASRDRLISLIKSAKLLQVAVVQKPKCTISEGTCDVNEKYGRWLVYLIADGINVNNKLIEDGFAIKYLSCQ